MKKIIVIVLGVVIIIGLTYFVLNLEKESKTSDTSLIAFAIEDTAAVNKIEIYDSFKNIEYTLTRNKEGKWEGPKGQCVQQQIPQTMLETMKKITLRGYVPKSAMENMKRLMMAQYKSVKIYQNGEWVKTWYIGQSTQDHLGTHMLLETPEIKSSNPVIMGMKGFSGILSPRFFADPREFVCTDLFSFSREDLKEIHVINRVDPIDSYKIEIKGPDSYVVSSQGEIMNSFNKENLVFYLNGFQNIHFNQPNYTLSKQAIDSMSAKKPDYELDIRGKKLAFHINLYRRPDPDIKQSDSLVYDDTYLWGIRPNGEVVRMQYYTVGPLIEGKMIFEEKASQH